MSQADKIFKKMCRDILENGYSSEGRHVRPRWPDGTPAHTIKQVGVVNRYDLSKEFPALTLRKTAIRSAFDEILWIYQKTSENINDLDSHIWDEWADRNGSIGKAYGYQIGLKYAWPDVREEGIMKAFPNARRSLYGQSYRTDETGIIAIFDQRKDMWTMNQINKVIYDLVNDPYSRRIMTNMYNFADLNEMALYPCAYSVTFNVAGSRLNAVLNQRSQDILAANNWNVCQYSLLVMMLAQVTGLEPGTLIHVIADAHIYDRHVPVIEELIGRKEYPAPKVTLDPEIKDFYSFTKDSVLVEDYKAGPQVKDIPIAI